MYSQYDSIPKNIMDLYYLQEKRHIVIGDSISNILLHDDWKAGITRLF